MAAGDITLKWGAETEISWTSGDPQNLADSTLTSLSNALTLSGLTPIVDIMIGARFRTQAGSLATDPAIFLYAASTPNGSDYPPADRRVLQLIGRPIRVITADTQQISQLFSLSAAFGGVLPELVKFALYNASGLQLTNTADENEMWYQIVYANQAAS